MSHPQRTFGPFLIVPLFFGGCGKVPIEAPEDLGELTRYLFRNFESETGEELSAGLIQLDSYLLTVDMEGDVDARAVTPPNLTEDDSAGVPIPDGVPLEDQVPVALSALSVWPLEEHVGLIVEPNQVCIASDGTKYHHREYLTDVDCFVDGSCDRLDTDNEIRFENFLAKIWLDELSDYRRIELDDGRHTMISRYWMENQYFSDNGSSLWDLRYVISVWIPPTDDPDKIFRFVSFWSAASMPGVGADVYAPLARNGLEEGFVNSDNWVDGIDCNNDRDREYDRP